jgi:hypothetical protein
MGIEMREEKVKYVELELNDPPLSWQVAQQVTGT